MTRLICVTVSFIAVSVTSYSQTQLSSANFIKDQGVSDKTSFQPMNGNDSLGIAVYDSACGLNYVQASQLVQTRTVAQGFNTNGTGLPTALVISGLSPSYTVRNAYVWYTAAIQSGSITPTTSVVITNPSFGVNTYSATLIGSSGPKCWGELRTAVYRADVTSNISGSGNYNVDITGLANKNWEVDGVTLMIIYQENSAVYQGSIMIWDGARSCSNGGCSFTQTMTGFSACTNSISGNAFLVVADMQAAGITPPQHNSTLNGATSAYSNDFYNFDLVNTSVTASQNTAAFGTAANNGTDCFNWSLMGLYYQTNCAGCCTSLVASATSTSINCLSGAGTATGIANCGTAPYMYSWSNGQTTQTATGLVVGNYTITITDSTSAVSSATVAVVNNPFVATTTITPVNCFGGTTGSASVNVVGGTAPYSYLWNPGGQTTKAATGLSTGTYSVIVTDAGSCADTFFVSVPGSPMMVLNINSTPSSCSACPDGSGVSNVAGGTPPYTYMWSNGKVTANITGLFPGTYTLCVTDANNCKSCDSVSVTALGVNEMLENVSVIVNPNPFNEFTTLQVNTSVADSYELKIFDLYGKEVDALITRDRNTFVIRRNGLSPGVYFYKVIAKDGRYAAGKLIAE